MDLLTWISEFSAYYQNYDKVWNEQTQEYDRIVIFDDDEVEILLRQACSVIFGGSTLLEAVDSTRKYQVYMMAKIFGLRKEAQNAAKYFNYTEGLSGDSVDKTKQIDNYIKLAEELQKEYEAIYPAGLSAANVTLGTSFVAVRIPDEDLAQYNSEGALIE